MIVLLLELTKVWHFGTNIHIILRCMLEVHGV